MDRRVLLKGSAATVAAAWVWIPKISIAKVTGDPRDAVIKSRKVISENWNLDQSSATEVAEGRSAYSSSVKESWSKLEQHNYTRRGAFHHSRASAQSKLALNGSFTENERNYCGSYIKRNEYEPIAYISTIPFIMHSFALERATKARSLTSTVAIFYPEVYIEIFDAYIEQRPRTPARVIAQDAIWVTTYDVASGSAGNGSFRVTKRGHNDVLYEEAFEYDFT